MPPPGFSLLLYSSLGLCSAVGCFQWEHIGAVHCRAKEYGSCGSHKVQPRSHLKDVSQKKDRSNKTGQAAWIWHSKVCKMECISKCQLCVWKRVAGKTTNRSRKRASPFGTLAVHAIFFLHSNEYQKASYAVYHSTPLFWQTYSWWVAFSSYSCHDWISPWQ